MVKISEELHKNVWILCSNNNLYFPSHIFSIMLRPAFLIPISSFAFLIYSDHLNENKKR